MLAFRLVMPAHSHKPNRHAVSAWIPLTRWLALKAAAGALGCAVSDLVTWCIERHADEVIKEEELRRARMVARNDLGGPNNAGTC